MTLWRFLGSAATVAGAAMAGWMLNERFSPSGGGQGGEVEPRAEVPAPPVSEPTPAFSVFSYPDPGTPASAPERSRAAGKAEVTLHGDGTVTLDVRKRSWRWVLEEVARQENARGQAAGGTPPEQAAEQAGQKEVLQALRSGDEASRYEALLNARTTGTAVPDELLRQLFEIDASERVRMLAFENYLERKSGSAEEVRSAAEAALYVPSPALQAEARKILEQLDAQARSEADDPQARAGGS